MKAKKPMPALRLELYADASLAAPPVWTNAVSAAEGKLDAVSAEVAAHAVELAGPLTALLYEDRNGNGVRDADEPAQCLPLRDAAALDAATIELKPDCPFWGWGAAQRAAEHATQIEVRYELPEVLPAEQADEPVAEEGESEGAQAMRAAVTNDSGPLQVLVSGASGIPVPGDYPATNPPLAAAVSNIWRSSP